MRDDKAQADDEPRTGKTTWKITFGVTVKRCKSM